MKIVLNAKGKLIAHHGEGEAVASEMYAGFGPVLVGTVPADWLDLSRGALAADALTVAAHIATQMVVARAEAAMANLSAKYPQAEQVSWGVKIAEAHQVLAGDESQAIYLADMAKARSIKIKDAAQKVLDKARAHSAALAKAEVDRETALSAIAAARTVEKVVAAL